LRCAGPSNAMRFQQLPGVKTLFTSNATEMG
jgi:hypothetical protein